MSVKKHYVKLFFLGLHPWMEITGTGGRGFFRYEYGFLYPFLCTKKQKGLI